MRHSAWGIAYKTGRKIVVGVIGGTLVVVGVVMLITPGPAIVVIPAGLAVLALEFAWARRWLKALRRRAGNAFKREDRPGIAKKNGEGVDGGGANRPKR